MSGRGPDSTPGFNGISGTSIQASAFSSIMESIGSSYASEASKYSSNAVSATATQATDTAASQTSPSATVTTATTRASSETSASSISSNKATSTEASASASSPGVPTTLSTSTLSSQTDNSPVAATPTQSPSGTATNAASNTSGAAVTVSDKCDSVSCNSGLQAAIAVPVVLGVLFILGLLFFLTRRRKRRSRSPPHPVDEKAKPKKKWSRHLRVFSFGEELLMGGRFSSTNSLRTGEAGSMRSGQPSQHSTREASIHSVDEVAPPYRDALSQAERPASGNRPFPRPSSTATAPPPYAAAAVTAGKTPRASTRATNTRPITPSSDRSRSDPFRDAESNPVSPIDSSPFNDPEDEDAQSPRPLMSRQSSTLSRLHDARSEVSTLQGSDAGSIREAQIARNVSMSGARTVRTVDVSRHSSQRDPINTS